MDSKIKIPDLTEAAVAEFRADANRKVNLTYLIAGAYVQALEMTEKAMDFSNLELVQRDKQLVKRIQQMSKGIIKLIEDLQEGSVLQMSAEDTLVHENTLHMFFALFMTIVSRAGIDKYSDLRLYNLYNIITSYPALVDFKFFQSKDHMAFAILRDQIAKDPNMTEASQGNILVTVDGKKKQILVKK